MRTLLGVLALAAISGPAFAQGPSDTLQAVIANGQTMSGAMQGMTLEFSTTYTADGAYTTTLAPIDRVMSGKWRIDGDRLCTQGDGGGPEDCASYPAGKRPGDTFEIDHPRLGVSKVTINPQRPS